MLRNTSKLLTSACCSVSSVKGIPSIVPNCIVSPPFPLLSTPSSALHTTAPVASKHWKKWKDTSLDPPDFFLKHNDKKYPPLKDGEEPRPAFVCHARSHIKYPPKKMWYIASLVRGLSIEDAINQLKFVHRKGAVAALEVLQEAQKMAVEEHNVEFPNNLWVAESFCYQDKIIKSMRRHARGRVGEISHRYVRYCVTLEEGSPPLHYYVYKRPLTPEEKIEGWLSEIRARVIPDNL